MHSNQFKRLIIYYKMIEKNIFQSWYTKDLHPLVQKKIDNLKQLNPEYIYHLYNDDDMDNFVNEYFPGEMLNVIIN